MRASAKSRSLPDTTCAYYEKENRLILFFPLTRVPYQLDLEEIPPGWGKLRASLEKVIEACKDFDQRSDSYCASVPLTKEDWEWVLTFSHHQNTKTA